MANKDKAPISGNSETDGVGEVTKGTVFIVILSSW